VLKLYGVDSLSINGSISFDKRDAIIQEFYRHDGPRVLIFSRVGSSGLNLANADCVILFVRCSFDIYTSLLKLLPTIRISHGVVKTSGR
jgi:superfamily II DNA/RNA helicase